jgi:hypothetical protein
MQRRNLIRGLSAMAALPLLPRMAWANPSPPPLSLLAAGPDGGQTSRWADASALALAANFPGNPAVLTQPDGGLDGVTGANQFDALVVPDGNTAAVLPGAALIAWITGDPRVHFDPTHWVTVMAGVGSGVLVVRTANGDVPDVEALRAMAPLRLAADSPQSDDLAALLALERMGVGLAPVFGLHDRSAKTAAFMSGAADAVFLAGEGVPEDIAPFSANNGVPVFCLGMPAAAGGVQPDALFPGLPDAIAYSNVIASPLDAAYRAAAAAARLDFIIVLPKLTDPGAVAQWRGAATGAAATPAMQAAASASDIVLVPSPVAAAALMEIQEAQNNQSALQAFLVQRFGWQPG